MRYLLAPLCAVVLVGASDETSVESSSLSRELLNSPEIGNEEVARSNHENLLPLRLGSAQGETECRDRVTPARAMTGPPPMINRDTASPDRPLAIYAVDRRQDGCSMMVMMGDPEDVHPLPALPEIPPSLIPAERPGQ